MTDAGLVGATALPDVAPAAALRARERMLLAAHARLP